jgi:hypothetical protein
LLAHPLRRPRTAERFGGQVHSLQARIAAEWQCGTPSGEVATLT